MSEIKPLNKRERMAQKRATQIANGEQPTSQPTTSTSQSSKPAKKKAKKQPVNDVESGDQPVKQATKQSNKQPKAKQSQKQSSKPSFMINQSNKPANQGWRRIELTSQMFDTLNQANNQAGFLCLEEISGAEFTSNTTRYDPTRKYSDHSTDQTDDQSADHTGPQSKKRKMTKQELEQKKKARTMYIPSLDYDPSESSLDHSNEQLDEDFEHSSDDEDQTVPRESEEYEQSNDQSMDQSVDGSDDESNEQSVDQTEEPAVEAEVTDEAQALLNQLMAEDDFDDEDDESFVQSEDELDESVDQSIDQDDEDVDQLIEESENEEEDQAMEQDEADETNDKVEEQPIDDDAIAEPQAPSDDKVNQLINQPVKPSDWDEFGLHPLIVHALQDKLGFMAPTDIQRKCLPPSINQWRDVIAASATGSGKTLAFGIPIINRLLMEGKGLRKFSHQSNDQSHNVSALILTPTRELALQIVNHLQAIAQFTHLKVISVVGGMSAQKQARLINRSPDVIVATPGRLYQLLTELTTSKKTTTKQTDNQSVSSIINQSFAQSFAQLRFLVLDEADRMTAAGHFSELESILDLIYKQRDQLEKESNQSNQTNEQSNEQSNNQTNKQSNNQSNKQKPLQHFLFSATLALDFSGRENMKTAHLKKKKAPRQSGNPVGQMIEKLRGLMRLAKSPFYIDLTGDKLVSTLNEQYINCLIEEKDFYFYSLVLQLLQNQSSNQANNGSTNDNKMIVFVNAISCLRRLTSLSQILGLPVYPLHAEMQQKQRLKSLDRFVRSSPSVLLTTDVSSRGLDIPQVNTVVHYQLPVNSEIYIHRCGRTARAGRDGQAIALISEKDSKIWGRIRKTCHGVDASIDRFDVDERCMNAARIRMTIARKIDVITNAASKQTVKRDWLKKHAEEMDMLIDSDDEPGYKETEEEKEHRSINSSNVRALQQELQRELKRPIETSKRHAKFFTLNIAEQLQQQADNQVKEDNVRASHPASKSTPKAGNFTKNKRSSKHSNKQFAAPVDTPQSSKSASVKPSQSASSKPPQSPAVKPPQSASVKPVQSKPQSNKQVPIKPAVTLSAAEVAIVANAKAVPIKLKRSNIK